MFLGSLVSEGPKSMIEDEDQEEALRNGELISRADQRKPVFLQEKTLV